MASVKVLFGGQEVQAYRLDQPSIKVGRDEACEIHIDNLGISRMHCQFERAPEGFIVRDLNSSNGTFVNGKRVQEHQLANNDQVLIGKFTLVFLDDGFDPAVASSTGTGASQQEAADGAGGFDQMHTYVMDGAAIRERLMAESGKAGGAGRAAPGRRPPASSGGSKVMLTLALLTLVILVAVAGVLVWMLMNNDSQTDPNTTGPGIEAPSDTPAPPSAPEAP